MLGTPDTSLTTAPFTFSPVRRGICLDSRSPCAEFVPLSPACNHLGHAVTCFPARALLFLLCPFPIFPSYGFMPTSKAKPIKTQNNTTTKVYQHFRGVRRGKSCAPSCLEAFQQQECGSGLESLRSCSIVGDKGCKLTNALQAWQYYAPAEPCTHPPSRVHLAGLKCPSTSSLAHRVTWCQAWPVTVE